MKRAFPILLLLAVVHLVLAGRHGLVDDEAYYWVWSQHLAAGYFDHPPAIAWVIAAGDALVGLVPGLPRELGPRLLPALLSSLGLAPLLLLTPRPRLLALALAVTPLALLGGVLATPDAPLIAAWCLGLWAAAERRWALFGLAAGLAMMSKYTGAWLIPALLLVEATEPRDSRIRPGQLALVLGLAGLLVAPNILWNAGHDFVSYRFQLGHVAGSETTAGAGPIAFVGAQAGLVGPLLFVLAGAWLLLRAGVVRGRYDRIDRLCWFSSAPLLLLATASGGEANWAAPAWLGLLVALSRMNGRWPRWVGFSAGATGMVSALAVAHLERPLVDLALDPTWRLETGPVLADSVAAWDLQPVLTARYQEAALIHFYSGVPAHALPGHGRADQYDLWPLSFDPENPLLASPPVDRLLFVRTWRADSPLVLTRVGWRHDGPNNVTAYADSTDPLVPVVAARWQVYDLRWDPPAAEPAP